MQIREIIGNTTTTPNPRPDWAQTDETKADYIKNKPTVLTENDVIELVKEHGGDEQIQSDWNSTDEAAADYIKNKPTVLTEDEVIEIAKEYGSGFSDSALPPITTEDDGKILQVVGGTWQAAEIDKYEGEYVNGVVPVYSGEYEVIE